MTGFQQREIQVLYVDDEPEIASSTAMFLERENDRFSVEPATSADEGLQRLAESEIDCIVSDYQMPGMDGIEFLESVAEEHPNLPFILYTGKGSEDIASEAISAGVTDYLQKQSGTDDYTLLANQIVHAVKSRRREQRITFFETLESELTELSIDFLRIEGRDIDTLIDRTLEKLGTLVAADRTYVFDIDHEAETLSNTHEWCSGGVEPQIDMLQDIPQDTLPWWTQKLQNFERITIPNVSELPPEAEAEQEILQEQNIESLIVTPMILNDELVGFIGFDWVKEQEAWSDEFINVLRMVSELITTARGRKQHRQELEEFGTIIESLTDAVYVLDEEGRFTYVNDEFVELVGYNRERILGNTPSLIKGEEAVEQAERELGRLLSSDGPKTVIFEVAIHPRTGDAIVCEDNMGVLPYDGETFDGSVGVLRDITEHREYERALEAQNERLEEFASIVSHDLRNPLSVAKGYVELTQETYESDHLDRAADALDRSQALIDDLLTLARNGDKVDETDRIDLVEAAKSSWQTVETQQATLDADVSQVIEADRSRFKQLFENLYRNAIEHGGNGVTVSVGPMDDGFYMADTGPGIPESDREKVFEAGYSTNEDGTGFGLRIVKQIADAHGWETTVTESDQSGARFEFTGVEFVE